jgi:hypothetical protein
LTLFGSQDRDQLSLQLALGMSWLLEPDDYEGRAAIYARAKKIYGIRSKVVHGGASKAADVEAAVIDLTEWLRTALVSLLTVHRPLLAREGRVNRLLLRDPSVCTSR